MLDSYEKKVFLDRGGNLLQTDGKEVGSRRHHVMPLTCSTRFKRILLTLVCYLTRLVLLLPILPPKNQKNPGLCAIWHE